MLLLLLMFELMIRTLSGISLDRSTQTIELCPYNIITLSLLRLNDRPQRGAGIFNISDGILDLLDPCPDPVDQGASCIDSMLNIKTSLDDRRTHRLEILFGWKATQEIGLGILGSRQCNRIASMS